MNFHVFFQRTIFIAGFITYIIIALLSQASFANLSLQTSLASPLPQASFASPLPQTSSVHLCETALQSNLTSSAEEVKDIIDVAKVISFLRKSNNHSRSPNGNIIIHPIDLLLASMTVVVEIDHHKTHVVKADLTNGIIFNSLKSLRGGMLLFDLQNRVWEKLNAPIKKRLSILDSYENGFNEYNGYVLTLDRKSTNSFDNIISQDVAFDQGALDLLQQVKTEDNGNTYIDPRDLLLAIIQSPDLYFIYDLFFPKLPEGFSFLERWFGDPQRRIDELRAIMSNSTNTSSEYTPILQLQILYYMPQGRQNNENGEAQSVSTDFHLLRKFGFPRKAAARSIEQIENNNFDRLRIRIKRRILRNTSSNELTEIEALARNEIDALINENDIKKFLKYHRSFTDEETETFMQNFIQRREYTKATTDTHITDIEEETTPQLHPRQQLIDRLNHMNQDDMAIFIKETGFEIDDDFIHHLMDPQKVPPYIRHFFIRFIADVSRVGSIFSIRTSNNSYGFKQVHYNTKNKKLRQSSLKYYSLHLGYNWVLVARKEGNTFILDEVTTHANYKKYF